MAVDGTRRRPLDWVDAEHALDECVCRRVVADRLQVAVATQNIGLTPQRVSIRVLTCKQTNDQQNYVPVSAVGRRAVEVGNKIP